MSSGLGTIYQVVDWDRCFESAKSKTYDHRNQTYMPNKHGLGYRRLVAASDGPAMFGAWAAMIQVLSRQGKPRQGYLTDNGLQSGNALSASDIALLISMSESIVEKMLQMVASEQVGWMISVPRIPQSLLKNRNSRYEGEGEGKGKGKGKGEGEGSRPSSRIPLGTAPVLFKGEESRK